MHPSPGHAGVYPDWMVTPDTSRTTDIFLVEGVCCSGIYNGPGLKKGLRKPRQDRRIDVSDPTRLDRR